MAWTIDGKAVARVGDLTVCPRCKGIFAITTGAPDVHMFGHAVARQDDLTACGARLIASGNSAWWDTDTNRTDDFFGGENALVEDSRSRRAGSPVDMSRLPGESGCRGGGACREKLNTMDVVERFRVLQQSQPALNIYALVDGLQYEQHFGRRITRRHGLNRSIWKHPGRAAGLCRALAGRYPEGAGTGRDCSSWSNVCLRSPGADHRRRPGGTGVNSCNSSSMRSCRMEGSGHSTGFHDPRVLGNLVHTLHAEQRAHFFFLVEEWHFYLRRPPRLDGEAQCSR